MLITVTSYILYGEDRGRELTQPGLNDEAAMDAGYRACRRRSTARQ